MSLLCPCLSHTIPLQNAVQVLSNPSPLSSGRFSTAVTSDSEAFEEDPFEDWTKTTHEKDSWANRERRRSNKFAKIDSDMALQQYERSRSGRRASSALGIFSQGIDKNGNAIVLSDHVNDHEDFELPVELDKDGKKLLSPSIAIAFARPDDRRLSMSSQNSDKRRGSILSLWKTGKDKDGKDHIHSGHEGEDWADAVSNTSESAPASPRVDNRGDRRGSILSIWSQGKDKEGKIVIHSGEEHEGDINPPLEKPESPKMRGQERRGSILSMWSEEKRDTQDRPAPVALKAHDEDDTEEEKI